ncbi:putative FAD/FMN-containing dehydrogenase [Vibrio nigripulchritudo SFn27]|uniref:Putative FAD/FMN-containing dehydrogenase n=1 Tax=Vibrio nigripulchritudo TaxID=28173 RepID=U4KHD6_9VIBR|nr:FAD-binding oxidoreductase [Vibrio nigripulchritudo]CCN81225.1 putative FAD/FMN-containing dehydrogenase [Vibrio nigripulchritudo BLFn1]CCN88191.1 putative FAD/FMN-containing dehydrogenase [Vibrio nigripulchritudo SFn27]CCN96105.1 putative FAD/FMN-containing dehydrogenase [Vibrio nigripulchritudo ENn2]CCO42339.1 putative FAD/FMN-containing dehydrogenase [Vibrio nigripulchritudo SFn135]CCO59454.1 putative FAD/FMN-containing dehydrogenase [Vibrio nigripulchritudo]
MSVLEPIASWTHTCATQTRICEPEKTDLTQPFIARGGGCSFGDASFLTDGQTVVQTLEPVIVIDSENMTCRVSANIEMGELHRSLIPNGYQFSVYGGTQWATVGGATASDIHGKNHHRVGSFGRHVKAIKLKIPSGDVLVCSAEENADLFSATIGGMGLTGMILEVELRIQPLDFTSVIESKTPFFSFEEMLALLREDPAFHYACLYVAKQPVNGWYVSADYAEEKRPFPEKAKDWAWLPHLPIVRDGTLQFANQLAKQRHRSKQNTKHVFAYNYGGPHQMVKQANRFLPKSGVIEFHYHLSDEHFSHSLDVMLAMAEKARLPLTHLVIKRMGDFSSPGMLAFTAPGWAINFQVQDNSLSRDFLSAFANEIAPLNPRFYLAKDACLSAEHYHASAPELESWQRIVKHIDPLNLIRSDLSQRLSLKPW